jgi:predicted patatin/cPLA2 family phospholipase
MKKLGLCIQGGGSRGIYAAKPLDLLMENSIWADEVFGTSCGGLMACDYVSKDIGRSAKLALIMAKDKEFFDPFKIFSHRKTMFDYHHLVFDIAKNELPFSFDVFTQNPCKLYVLASNALTGGTDYLEKNTPDFLPNAIAASAALPLTSAPVDYQGVPYLDGGITCPIGFEKALADGCDKVIVVATQAKGYRKGEIKGLEHRLVKRMYHAYPTWLEVYAKNHEIYNAQMDLMDHYAEAGKIFVIYPSVDPHVSHSERDIVKLQELMELGEKDAAAQISALKEYLSK